MGSDLMLKKRGDEHTHELTMISLRDWLKNMILKIYVLWMQEWRENENM